MAEVEEAVAVEGGEVAEMDLIGVGVALDPKEHQDWLWATQEDIIAHQCGDTPLMFVNKGQQDIKLRAFGRRDIPS